MNIHQRRSSTGSHSTGVTKSRWQSTQTERSSGSCGRWAWGWVAESAVAFRSAAATAFAGRGAREGGGGGGRSPRSPPAGGGRGRWGGGGGGVSWREYPRRRPPGRGDY